MSLQDRAKMNIKRPIKIYWAVIVEYGRKCPKGYLPAGSVETEDEARQLIERCCEQVYVTSERRIAYMAPELEEEQTIENLYAFGVRLETEYQNMLAEKSRSKE